MPTNAELQQLCAGYQRLLRLQDWRVRVVVVGIDELQEQGQVFHNLDGKLALIKVLKEEDYDEDKWMEPYDAEAILVHELLHIQYHAVDKEECPEYEFAHNAVAEALVTLRRKLLSRDSSST